MEISRYQWSRKKQYDITEDAHGYIKPKDGVVVICCGMLYIGESLGKTAALEVAGDETEYGENSHNTIIVG